MMCVRRESSQRTMNHESLSTIYNDVRYSFARAGLIIIIRDVQ